MGRGRFLFDLWGLCLVTHACAAAFLAGVLATVLPAAIRRGCCCRWQRHCAGFSAVIFYVLVLLCRFLCCCVSRFRGGRAMGLNSYALNWISVCYCCERLDCCCFVEFFRCYAYMRHPCILFSPPLCVLLRVSVSIIFAVIKKKS